MKTIGAPFNSLFSWIIRKRIHQIDLFRNFPHEVQFEVFQKLITSAQDTVFGRKYDFYSIKSYQDFKKAVPLHTYDELKPLIDELIEGKQNLLWPSDIQWFAKSSGTTSGKSKIIPVSKEALEDCHYKGGKDLLALYYNDHPKTKLFKGKHLILGGSAQVNYLNSNSYYGDLSAIIVKNLPWWCEFRRTPSREITLMTEWDRKLDKIVENTTSEDVHILAGVPSWTLVLLKKMLAKHDTENILDIWPNLELYMHGGVNFEPYRTQFEKIIKRDDMSYLQTYNASEGFFGIQDEQKASDMLLMLDYGIFYEFIPMSEFHTETPPTLTLEEVEKNQQYAMVISSNAGLWRYIIGDVIEFSNLSPYKIRVVGRTTHYINAFGEELIVENAESAMAFACKETNSSVREFTACPIYMNESSGAHQWLIEFENAPSDIDAFKHFLDQGLKENNSDYEAKRSHDLTIGTPQIISVENGTFYDWLKKKGKLGGQNKIPRLSNNRKIVEEILAI